MEDNITVSPKAQVDKNAVLKGRTIIHGGAQIIGYCIIEDSEICTGAVVTQSVIEKSYVGENAVIGPFAHLRAGSKIGKNCKIGNFVEVKNSVISDGSKASHLAYIGDAAIGENCNIGCGVIFCNYDGKTKHKSKTGDNVFIGSNCNIVAPAVIGSGAYIACGTTVSGEIDTNCFMIGRVKAEKSEKLYKKFGR